MSKKGKMPNFSKMLKENEKKILVSVKGEEMKLSVVTDASVNDIICTALESVVPVSVTEAAENSVPGVKKISASTSYAQTAWSLYENALKNGDIKQTMLILAPVSDFKDILNGVSSELESLYSRTNIEMIMENFPEKLAKRVSKWSEEKNQIPDMFVVKIPNIVLFTESIRKNEPCASKLFDLVICLVKSEKSLKKLKKKDKDEFTKTVDFAVSKSINILKDLGSSCVHVTIDDRFMDDPHDYADIWSKHLLEDASKGIISNVTFCTTDTDTLVSFNNTLTNAFLDEVLSK